MVCSREMKESEGRRSTIKCESENEMNTKMESELQSRNGQAPCPVGMELCEKSIHKLGCDVFHHTVVLHVSPMYSGT